MFRGFVVAALAAVALAGLPTSAYADEGDPIVYMSVTDGWAYPQGYDISFGFICVSPTSAIVSCEASQPMGSKLDTFYAGPHTVWVTATDYEGRQTTASATYTVIDITKPHVIFTTPSEGATFEQGSSVTADYACADDPGGLGLFEGYCFGTIPLGAPIDTSQIGTFSFSVTTVDKQFNVDQEVVHYSVVDRTPPTITFASPTDAASMKAGENVPLKFSLHGDQGLDIFAAGSPGWAPCGALDGPTRADGTLSYNASADRYTYQATTSKSWAGSCRDLIVTLNDGTAHRARFSFTK
jgi:hypothetical protein